MKNKTWIYPLCVPILSFPIRGCIQKFPDWVITKYTPTTINTRWEATQRVMAAKLGRVTHKIATQLHLVAESCTLWSSRSRRPVRKLLDTPSYSRHKAPIPIHSAKSSRFIKLQQQKMWVTIYDPWQVERYEYKTCNWKKVAQSMTPFLKMMFCYLILNTEISNNQKPAKVSSYEMKAMGYLGWLQMMWPIT
jgi:hypothetical protein